MSETIEESYNRLVDDYNALNAAILTVCNIDLQRKIKKRQKEVSE